MSVKISELPAASTLAGTELIPVVQSGETRQAVLSTVMELTGTVDASNVGNTPAGNISAVNVQGALNELDSEKLAASSYTAADVLTKLQTVDGASSGLDADLLDGNHATAFALTGHNHAGTYEPALGNPATNGYVLSSTTAGVRSWVAAGSVPTTYGAIGTYVIALVADGSVALGGTVAGSDLSSANQTNNVLNTTLASQGALVGAVASVSSLGLSGTWRLMTNADGNSSYSLGLFLRIA